MPYFQKVFVSILAVITFAVSSSGCSFLASDANTETVDASVDEIQYSPGDQITFSIKNKTRAAVRFVGCCAVVGYYVLQRRDGTWKQVKDRGMTCPDNDGELELCAVEPLQLEPDESFSRKAVLDSRGAYRLVFRFYDTHDNGASRTIRETRTSVFVVK